MYPALANNPDYTRIINGRHYQRITDLVEDARGRGADVVALQPSNEANGTANRVFPPILITNVDDGMAVMQEEIFGPVLPIVEYDTLEDAIAYVGHRPRPLALYYFDDDRRRVRQVLERTVSGGVTINDCVFHVGQPGLPFGGVGASGMGRYHGADGFEAFSNRKGVLLQPRWSALSLLRPPYTARTRRILRLLMR
jgi:coniferyl-aldehyde dehydrogenase